MGETIRIPLYMEVLPTGVTVTDESIIHSYCEYYGFCRDQASMGKDGYGDDVFLLLGCIQVKWYWEMTPYPNATLADDAFARQEVEYMRNYLRY